MKLLYIYLAVAIIVVIVAYFKSKAELFRKKEKDIYTRAEIDRMNKTENG